MLIIDNKSRHKQGKELKGWRAGKAMKKPTLSCLKQKIWRTCTNHRKDQICCPQSRACLTKMKWYTIILVENMIAQYSLDRKPYQLDESISSFLLGGTCTSDFYNSSNRKISWQIVEILIRHHILNWICTVCPCPIKRTVGLYSKTCVKRPLLKRL